VSVLEIVALTVGGLLVTWLAIGALIGAAVYRNLRRIDRKYDR
jgi:H+/Cl- antiporter ClcA